MLRPAAALRTPAWAWPQPRHQPGSSRLPPGRRRAHRLAAHHGAPGAGDDDDELPPPPTPMPRLADLPAEEVLLHVERWAAEKKAYDRALERRRRRAEARKAAGAPPPPLHPLASLAAAWPPAADSTLPASTTARSAAAEAMAAAAVAFAGAAVGHEAAARAAAATQPASSLEAAGEEWLRAGTAWRKAFQSLEAAQRAQPEAAAVLDAAVQVEAAHRFSRQLRGLPSPVADDLA